MSRACSYKVVPANSERVGDNGAHPKILTFDLPDDAAVEQPFIVSMRATFHGDADDFHLELRATRTSNLDGGKVFYSNVFNNADDVPVPRQLQFVVQEGIWKTDNDNVIRLAKIGGDGTLTIDDVVVFYKWKAAS
jgi:hypothetical protein